MGERWQAVDDYIAGKLLGADDALAATLANNAANGLPPIDVSAAQGKMLFLLAQTAGAKNILEIGTLGGYSTIWLARALPEGGRLVTLELDAHHADVARANLERAGVGGLVDIRVGPASDTLAAMTGETAAEAVRRVRMHRAACWLVQTDAPVADVVVVVAHERVPWWSLVSG